ncbi:MAG: hypothetical protein LBS60_01555 [Deltaproteobacteria bacterium]|jgi:hypothetical protein|nr:hypothetical protein [Deltaproteobacteria bacterium]
MKKRVIKLAILALGLGVLIWWGWSGNFSFKSGSFFPFEPREDYYALMAGTKTLGYAQRAVTLEEKTGNLTLNEITVINLSVIVADGEVRCFSQATFDKNGSILSASLTIGLDPSSSPIAQVTGEVAKGELTYRIIAGGSVREVKRPIPESGPILISGLVPWLAHQQDLPLGRPIFFNIFDPSRLEFRPASLTIIDVTPQAVETKVYKLALLIDPSLTEIWVEATGQVQSQKAEGVDFGLEVLKNPEMIKEATAVVKAPAKPGFLGLIPKAFLDMVIKQGVGAIWPEETGK